MMPFARKTDPATSHQAAQSVENVTETQKRILDLFRTCSDFTDEELVMVFKAHYDRNKPESTIRSRRAELVARGLIEDSGNRRKMTTGRNAIVWQLTKEEK